MKTTSRTLRTWAALAALASAAVLGAGEVPATAATTTTTDLHCSAWTRIVPSVAVAVRSCVRLEKSGTETTVIGRFGIRNNTYRAKVVSLFPQAESKSGAGSPITAQMGGATQQMRIPARTSTSVRRQVAMVTGTRMWVHVEYLLFRRTTSVRFVDSPHVQPPWR